MSTTWWFACVSHDPVLLQDDGVGGSGTQGRDVLIEFWRKRELYAGLDDKDACAILDGASTLGERQALRFLMTHPECTLQMWNERGERYEPASQVLSNPRHDAERSVAAVRELIRKAHEIGGAGMTVYAHDLEVALGMRADEAPHKLGQNA